MQTHVNIPCDYSNPNGRHTDDGQFLIYGEMGAYPPQLGPCPKCKGEKVITVERSYIQSQIDELEKEREELNDEIKILQSYLE